jgi:hypothetical protein
MDFGIREAVKYLKPSIKASIFTAKVPVVL